MEREWCETRKSERESPESDSESRARARREEKEEVKEEEEEETERQEREKDRDRESEQRRDPLLDASERGGEGERRRERSVRGVIGCSLRAQRMGIVMDQL